MKKILVDDTLVAPKNKLRKKMWDMKKHFFKQH